MLYRNILYRIILYRNISYRNISYRNILYHIVSFRILPYGSETRESRSNLHISVFLSQPSLPSVAVEQEQMLVRQQTLYSRLSPCGEKLTKNPEPLQQKNTCVPLAAGRVPNGMRYLATLAFSPPRHETFERVPAPICLRRDPASQSHSTLSLSS